MAFIVFEGLDGSGKSSLMEALLQELTSQGLPWVKTREPGGTQLGDDIRHLLLRKEAESPVPKAELLLYEASRAQLVELFIRPHLQQKKWVICDRYAASSVAFQGGGRGISVSEVEDFNRFATGDLKPDLTVLLDLPVTVSLARQKKREQETGQSSDRMESESQAFHEKVRQSFLQQAQQQPSFWLVLSAEETPQKLRELLLTELRKRKWIQ